MDMNPSKPQEMVEDGGADVLQSLGSQRVGHDLVTEQRQQVSLRLAVVSLLAR